MKNEITDHERSALDKLFAQTELVAKGQMARTGKIHTAMVLMTADNKFIDLESSQLEFIAKQGKFRQVVQAACIEADVVASTMLLPNILTAKDDKQEVALILGGTRTLREERAMPVMRTAYGHFLGFAETWHLPHSPESEKFQDFIPKEEPSKTERLQAKTALCHIGMVMSRPCDHGHHPYREEEDHEEDKRQEQGRGLDQSL